MPYIDKDRLTPVLRVGYRAHGAVLVEIANDQGDCVAFFGINSRETMAAYKQATHDLGYELGTGTVVCGTWVRRQTR